MFASKSVPSIQMYSEIPGEGSPPEADVEEFAKRIGIDLEREPHLRYLAVEGITEPLPHPWKPCYDQTKRSWYYFNKKSQLSQWEHPMNEVYRDKVAQTRQQLAMNRILDTSLPSRPPKSLPPLKKLGGSKPVSNINKLGPIVSAPNVSSSHSNNAKVSLSEVNNSRVQSNSLGDLINRPETTDANLQNPSSRMVKKPLGGLMLTGEGANFLKGSSGPVKKSEVIQSEKLESNGVAELNQNSIKSILSSSFDQSKKGSGKHKNFEPWEMNPDKLTETEKKMLEEISLTQKKPGVKFQLDENTELKFEMSTDDNVTKSDESESDEESSEEDEASDSRPVRVSQSHNTESQHQSQLSNASARNVGAGEKASSHLNMSAAAAEAMKETMRKDLEDKLKEYQEELDKERLEREAQIRQHMDMTIRDIKMEKETAVWRVRTDLEEQKDIELDKVKRELESMIKVEVEKMKTQFEQELEKKKTEIREQHKQAMSSLSKELETLEEEQTAEVLQRKHSEETLKLQAELKDQKETMREDQKKQIMQMKDYHKSFIEKLREDLKEEELKLQNEHQSRLSEILKSFEKETSELKTKLKSEQDAILSRLKSDFEKERQLVEKELKEGLSSLRNEMNTLKSKTAVSQEPTKPSVKQLADVNLKTSGSDEELKTLSAKYYQLEKKYGYLKKELNKLAVSNKSMEISPRKSKVVNDTLIQNIGSEPSSVNTQDERDVPSDSQSDSTLYPSSSVNPQLDQKPEKDKSKYDNSVSIEDLIETNNNRLAAALKSVEILKSQIIDIKHDQESLTTSREYNQKAPKSAKKSTRHNSPVSSGRSAKKKNNHAPNNGSRTPKKVTVPYAPPPTRSGIRVSRSTSELPGLVEDSEESNEIVKEAKEFIRTQKERLNVPAGNIKFEKPISTTWTSNSPKGYRYSVDEGNYPKARTTYLLSPKQPDIYSETESSGVGSMKDLKSSQEKKQISEDIEAICSSLSHLDDQMRLMWSVVQGNAQDKPTSANHNLQNNVISSLPNQVIPTRTSSSGGKRPNYSSSARPVTSLDLQSLAPSVMSTSNRALIDTLKSSNLPSRVSASNLLNSLDKELKEFKAAKERILNQFTPQKNTPSESIQEKTKDLREWLEKF